jgi:hypothetical protein
VIARHYAGLIDALVIDEADDALAGDIGVPALVTRTLMTAHADKVALARQCLGLCERLAGSAATRRGG